MRSRAHHVAARRLNRARWFGSGSAAATSTSRTMATAAEEAAASEGGGRGVLEEHQHTFNHPIRRVGTSTSTCTTVNSIATSTASAPARAVRGSCWHHRNIDQPRLRRHHHHHEQQHVPFSSSAPDNSSSIPSSSSSSVSSEEVAHFDALAATWWDADRNPLIGMNPTRVTYIVDMLRSAGLIHVPATSSTSDTCSTAETTAGTCGSGEDSSSISEQQPLRGLRALDVGCGGGLLSESLARLGATVTAVDPSVEVANAAREHSEYHPITRRIDYRGGMSVEDLAREIHDDGIGSSSARISSTANRNGDDGNENDKSARHLFDLVCVLEVVEHAADPKSLLDNACRLLRPGGMLFVSTLNRTAKSYVLAIAGAEHVMRMVPVGTHRWDKLLSPAEVGGMVTSVSSGHFEVVDVCGMVLAPPFVNMQWILDRNDVSVNWIGAYRRAK
mmetsp:Transcript_13349/g.28978  ORF Transcript_13349/g.28978 Transcript_13349/m.28978 type:complete len:445 (+) Transcript_13349:62-1396(+)